MTSIYEEKGLIASKNARNHMPRLEMPLFLGKSGGNKFYNYTTIKLQ